MWAPTGLPHATGGHLRLVNFHLGKVPTSFMQLLKTFEEPQEFIQGQKKPLRGGRTGVAPVPGGLNGSCSFAANNKEAQPNNLRLKSVSGSERLILWCHLLLSKKKRPLGAWKSQFDMSHCTVQHVAHHSVCVWVFSPWGARASAFGGLKTRGESTLGTAMTWITKNLRRHFSLILKSQSRALHSLLRRPKLDSDR